MQIILKAEQYTKNNTFVIDEINSNLSFFLFVTLI